MSKPYLKILAYEETPLGILCLRKREMLKKPGTFVTEITLDHEFLMSSYNTKSECALSEKALEMHQGQNLEVLVGGLGLGYTAHAALKSERVSNLQVIEFLPQVISWMKDGLVPLSEVMNSEERCELVQADFYERLMAKPQKKYDLILVDIDHSPNEHLDLENNNELFYTEEGLKRAKEHLNPNGILGVWSYAESSPFEKALRNVFEEVCVEEIDFENKLVDEKHVDWLFFAKNI